MKSNIALIGMMGTSKTTSGKKLADLLDMMFLDLDDLIEYEEMPIPELFARYGEEGFREIESKKLRRASTFSNVVIACGGGVVKRAENMAVLKRSAYIVLLTASAKTIYERVKTCENRPLLKNPTVESVRRILNERAPLYDKYADISVATDELTPEEIAGQISDNLYEYINQKREERK